mmetsp:Transcript_33934/g.104170  ORF Transcript_33934/g.104170 Transcript_33934/m.104170 type:complete len:176 (+) Transcript_33934:85-612(+)
MSVDAQAERQQKDDALRTTIMQKLVETGEKERLKELLRQKLIECGWRDELKEYCKEVIRSKGLEKITVDELVAEITPRGRATVPDEVKTELLQTIRKFLQVRRRTFRCPPTDFSRPSRAGDVIGVSTVAASRCWAHPTPRAFRRKYARVGGSEATPENRVRAVSFSRTFLMIPCG